MNEADSRAIAAQASAAGYDVVAQAEHADVVVLNTCTVRDNAEQRAYGRLGHFKTLKDRKRHLRVIVCGCLAEQDREKIQANLLHVDGVFGTSELARLGETLAKWREQAGEEEDSSLDERWLDEPLGRDADCIGDAYSHLRAFVTVQRGCSYYCTFCIVPYVRGRFDHRPMEEILAEVRRAVECGAREIMLVGQTVNAYREPATGVDFGELCRAVAAIEGLDRLTFISPHPKDFSEKMVRDFARIPQLNPRVHLPLQSASDPILRRMNRKYTFAEYQEKVAWFGRFLPSWLITTDIIVGFPGETEEDFRATLDYCASGVFSQAFMFIYSQRRGTPAAQWEQVPPERSSERFKRLVAAQDAACRATHQRKIGQVQRALIQGPSKKDPQKLALKTTDNVTAIVPRVESLGDPARPWIDVRIEEAFTWGVTGTAIGDAEHFDAPARRVLRPLIDLTTIER